MADNPSFEDTSDSNRSAESSVPEGNIQQIDPPKIGPESQARCEIVAALLAKIGDAKQLALAAETACRASDTRARNLQMAAEQAHYYLLRTICRITSAEADAVELAFTDFEECLLRLPNLRP